MQRIIAVVVVLAAVGIVSAFAASQVLSNQVAAAPPCSPNPNPPRCTPTPTATASATPTPTPTPTSAPTPIPSAPPILQVRESVLPIIAGKAVSIGGPSTGAWIEVRDEGPAAFRLPLDASHYLGTTEFRLHLAGSYGGAFPAVPVCIRLSEVVAGGLAPVAGSDVCVRDSGPFSVTSVPFSLPSGSHTYTLETSGNASLFTTGARVVAEWTELVP